jgi:hypothetical protein
MLRLQERGFARITLTPLRKQGELPFEIEQVYLPYRRLFQYERTGPEIAIYARPGMPLPPPGEALRRAGHPGAAGPGGTRRGDSFFNASAG